MGGANPWAGGFHGEQAGKHHPSRPLLQVLSPGSCCVWNPVLASLSDGLRWGWVSQINPFLTKAWCPYPSNRKEDYNSPWQVLWLIEETHDFIKEWPVSPLCTTRTTLHKCTHLALVVFGQILPQVSFLKFHVKSWVWMCICVQVPSEARGDRSTGAGVPGGWGSPDAGAGNRAWGQCKCSPPS